MCMSIDIELAAMQLADSFFPSGIYATSNGLEFLFAEKKICSVEDLTQLIKINIIQQIGPTDCIALAGVFDSAENKDIKEIIKIDDIVFATKLVKEIRDASVKSGQQLVRCVLEFVKDDEILNQYEKNKMHGIFPVSFAICCNAMNIKKEKSMAMLLYGFTVGMVGAALRLGLIQHFEAQKVIHEIKPVISKTVSEYSERSISEMWQFAPQVDISQMSHEKMDSKMFIT